MLRCEAAVPMLPGPAGRRLLLSMLMITLLMAPVFAAPGLATPSSPGWPHDLGWPTYGGTNLRAGSSPAVGPSGANQVATPVALQAPSFTAPVADLDGNIYVGDESGTVTKLHPDFATAWTASVGGPLRASLALGPDGTVYAAPVGDFLYALDGETGEPRETLAGDPWRAAIHNTDEDEGYVLTSAPAYHPDGMIIVGSLDGHVYAVSAATAEVLWKTRTDPPATSEGSDKVPGAAAIGSDGSIYVGGQNGILYKLGSGGKIVWQVETRDLGQAATTVVKEEQIVSSPSLGPDGRVYVTTRLKREFAGMVYAFDDKGTEVVKTWTRQLDEKITAPVTVDGRRALYVGALDGTFYRLDPGDGTIAWDFHPQDDDPSVYEAVESPNQVTNPLTVAELAILDAAGRIYVPYWHVSLTKGFPPQGSEPSPLYALDAADGSVVWRAVFDKTIRSPALVPMGNDGSDGTRAAVLYVAGDDGRAYAFGDIEPATTPADADVEAPAPDTTEPAPEPDPNSDSDGSDGADGSGDGAGASSDDDVNGIPAPGALGLLMTMLVLGRRWRCRRA